MTNIGIQNLIDALARHTRITVEGNWVVGASATTTAIPATLPDGTAVNLSAPIQDQLSGLIMEFTDGANRGTTRQVVSIDAAGTLQLDSAVGTAPAQGDSFVLMAGTIDPGVASQMVGNMTVGAGTQAFLSSGDEAAFNLITVNGTYRINGSLYGTTLTVNLGGEVICGDTCAITMSAF